MAHTNKTGRIALAGLFVCILAAGMASTAVASPQGGNGLGLQGRAAQNLRASCIAVECGAGFIDADADGVCDRLADITAVPACGSRFSACPKRISDKHAPVGPCNGNEAGAGRGHGHGCRRG